MDPNVDLVELGKKTKNFSGAEIEGLVRAAQSSAMNRLVKAGGEVKVDEDAVEKVSTVENLGCDCFKFINKIPNCCFPIPCLDN